MTTINISTLNKPSVLAALFNAIRQMGMGFMHTDGRASMTVADAAALLEKDNYFDYLRGRVRETWRLREIGEAARNAGLRSDYVYRATENVNGLAETWTPSIFMPRAASRITLEITDVRVERLKDISEADAKAEGCEQVGVETGVVDVNGNPQEIGSYAAGYYDLWETINGPGSWDANPWVWAISFKRIQQGA